MNDKQEPIIYRTNQAWKYFAPMASDLAGVIALIFSIYYYSDTQKHFTFLTISMILLTIGFAIKYSIKCPKCRVSWYWLALKKPLSENAVVKVRLLNSCPNCGYKNDSVT